MAAESKFQLRVASPCKAPWENMDGDEQVRFCRECSRNVYNLSAMTETEARRVIADREGRLCIRFYQRRDGTVLTSDCPVSRKRSFLRTGARTAVAIAGTPPVDVDWDASTEDHDEPVHPDELMMGDMEIPPGRPLMGRIAPPGDGD